jgi:hypothetical protein
MWLVLAAIATAQGGHLSRQPLQRRPAMRGSSGKWPFGWYLKDLRL